MTLAARIAEAKARVGDVVLHSYGKSANAEKAVAWVLDAFEGCLLALADEVPHIRKSETACTIACPCRRLRAKVEEALG